MDDKDFFEIKRIKLELEAKGLISDWNNFVLFVSKSYKENKK